MDDLYEPIETDPLWLERSGDSFATGGSTLGLLGPLGGLAVLSGLVVGLTWALGVLWVGLVFSGVLMMLTTTVRVELGLLLLVAIIPWEGQIRLFDLSGLIRVMGILVAFLGLLHIFFKAGQKWPTTFKVIAAFCLWTCIGVAAKTSVNTPLLTLVSLLTLLSNAILIYLCFRFCPEPTALRSLIIVIFISSVGQALLGLLMGVHIGAEGRMSTSKDIDTNYYARLMFFGVFLAPIVFVYFKSAFVKILAVLGILVSLISAMQTGSRGANLGMFAGGVLMVLTIRSARFRIGAKLITMASALVLVLVAWIVVSGRGGGQLWAGRISVQGLSRGAQDRIWRWKESIEMGLENPVLGVGYGNEALAYYLRGAIATESHNDVISVLAMTGIPGLVLYLVFLVAWLREVWRMPYGIWRSSLLGMWLAFTTTGIFNPSLNKKSFWLAVAICATSIVCSRRWLATRCESPHADGPVP